MKILFLTSVYYPDIIGGGEISTQLVTEGLAQKGHSVYVLALALENRDEVVNGVYVMRRYIPLISEEYISNIRGSSKRLPRLSSRYKIMNKYVDVMYSFRWYSFYKKLFKERDYDLIHSVSPLSYTGRYNAWKAAYDLNIPVSHISRSPDLVEFQYLKGKLNYIYRKLNSRAAKYLKAIAAPSNYMLNCHLESNIKAPIMKTIYNAVDIAQSGARQNADFKNKIRDVVYAGDLREEKGIITLYNAVKTLKSCSFTAIGNGELLENLKQYNDVELPGWLEREKLYSYMHLSKVFVLPSEWNEAFGRVLIEAIANGTIAIGSNQGGIPEVLNHDNRYIFKSGDVNELAKKIQRVLNLNEKEYCEELKQQQDWLDSYTTNEYLEKWEKFFSVQLK